MCSVHDTVEFEKRGIPATMVLTGAFRNAATHQFRNNLATIGGSGDVEKRQLVRALEIVTLRLRDRIARVRERDKANAFDDTAVVNVETGNDSFRKHYVKNNFTQRRKGRRKDAKASQMFRVRLSAFAPLREKFLSIRSPTSWLFSG